MENENLIAIVGASGRFPDANTIDELWKNLLEKKECIKQFTKEELIREGLDIKEVEQDNYIRAKGVINSPNSFDADFFGYTVKEAMIIDPQSRVLLEEVWKAIEDSGNKISDFDGRVGIYAGSGMNTYVFRAVQKGLLGQYDDFDIMLGSDKDILSTRIAYKMNFTGPSITIQSTCSTSLVAVHLACQGLLSGDCDMAVAGGVSIAYPIKQGYKYRKGMIFSKSGHCSPFEEKSDGTIFSDGAGVVVLKRLEDALEDNDDIYGVILGSTVNNDGNNKVGFTAPSPSGQAEVIRDCLTVADVSAETIDYVEAHGTATEIGDLLEFKAISKVYKEDTMKDNYCALGSVKSNVGHLNTASGITGLIKAMMVLKEGIVPAMPNFKEENKELNLKESPFYINKENVILNKDKVRRVAVSSFGIGGTNAHIILEEAPLKEEYIVDNKKYMFPFSARTKKSLLMYMKDMSKWLEGEEEINIRNVAKNLQCGREVFDVRKAIVSDNKEDLLEQLKKAINEEETTKSVQKPIYFLITGQGSQYINMAKDLYENIEFFRNIVDEGMKFYMDTYEEDFLEVLYPKEENYKEAKELINNTEYSQPIIFVVSYALGRYLMHLGIKPNKMIGHSLGEYVGACLAEVMTFKEGLDIIYWRGKYLQSVKKGQMLAVRISKEKLLRYRLNDVYVSTINSPESVVLGGTYENILDAKELLKSENIICHQLSTSHAFHTPMMREAAEKFAEYLKQYELKDPCIDLISNTTGALVKKGQMCSVDYWKSHILKPVLFENSVKQLLMGEEAIFIEIGSGKTLIDLAKQQRTEKEHIFVDVLPVRYYKKSQYSFFLEKIAWLWENGVTIDFRNFQTGKYNKMHMPTYRFDRQEFSLFDMDKDDKEESVQYQYVNYKANIKRDSVNADYVEPRDEVEGLLLELLKENIGVENIGVFDNFFELGLSSLSASQYAMLIKESIDLDIEIQDIIESACVADFSKIVTKKLLEEA